MTEPVLMVANHSGWRVKLESEPFQLATWPVLQIQPPESPAALDEAIANLYGYDWIIFISADSVQFFLERLALQGRAVSDLDSLRVCSVGEATTGELEPAQIHVDVIATHFNAATVVKQIENFAGGHDALDRSNFLIPQAAIGRHYLKQHLEEMGARVDVVAAFQTVSTGDLTRLSGLHTMLRTGSVDAVLFASAGEVHDFARVFDTNDIGALVSGTRVITNDDETSNAVIAFGVSQPIRISEPSSISIAEALSQNAG